MRRGRAWSSRSGLAVAWVLLGVGSPFEALAAPRRTTVFLDFGGGPVGPGDDASLGQATCVGSEFLFPIFLGSERAADVARDEAQRLVAPYGVRVVTQRPPPHLPYTHVRVGGAPEDLTLDSKLNGLACQVDCDDRSPRDTVFTFADKWLDTAALTELDEYERAVQVGRISIHEAAHAWGLEHAGASESLMARFPSAGQPQFVVGCQPQDLDGESECPEVRTRYCPAGQQDADAELRALFGDGVPDTVAPTARIRWPPDGHVVEPGATVTVEVEVADDYEGFGWLLEVPQLDWQHIARDVEQTEVSLVVPAGRWTLRLEAIDHDRNIGEAVVNLEARSPEEVPVDEPLAPQSECACRSHGTAATSWLCLWLWLVVGAGRRRPVSAPAPAPGSPARTSGTGH
ncbi:MAG: hypothetical protein AAGF11_52115 [Myxococcota bacterium]